VTAPVAANAGVSRDLRWRA